MEGKQNETFYKASLSVEYNRPLFSRPSKGVESLDFYFKTSHPESLDNPNLKRRIQIAAIDALEKIASKGATRVKGVYDISRLESAGNIEKSRVIDMDKVFRTYNDITNSNRIDKWLFC